MKFTYAIYGLVFALFQPSLPSAAELCTGFGPQTPRDISKAEGTNPQVFPIAPAAREMNLCDIHTHTNAEHKGPGFSVFAGNGKKGGYQCNGTKDLSKAELRDPTNGQGRFGGVVPGDTLEVHWVYTTCQVDPGPTLDSCFSASCANPTLRVETQVFLVVNDDTAPDFGDFTLNDQLVDGLYQTRSLPSDTGMPVTFLGSTTGPSYSQSVCSPLEVTWSVRPECAKLSFSSLNAWATKGNVFEEEKSQKGRALVTAPELLAPIK
jgi:hypothetical protein